MHGGEWFPAAVRTNTRGATYRTRKLSAMLRAVGVLFMMARREASNSRVIITEMPVLNIGIRKTLYSLGRPEK